VSAPLRNDLARDAQFADDVELATDEIRELAARRRSRSVRVQ
jgi:hypothetical protein